MFILYIYSNDPLNLTARIDIEILWQNEVEDADDAEVPVEFVLESVYPNPFNSTASIQFGLPSAARVWFKVIDIRGRQISILADGNVYQPGWHNFTFNAADLPAGVYFVEGRFGNQTLIKKATLIR